MIIHGATRQDPWLGYFRLDAMLVQFLSAPSARSGLTNGALLESVVGASVAKPSACDTIDPATFDGASGRHDRQCRTFREAFAACAVAFDRYGHRHWRTFDLATLQGCHGDFAAFRLPEWVEARIVEEETAAYYCNAAPSPTATDETVPF